MKFFIPVLFLLISGFLFAPPVIQAKSEYTPPGLYSVEQLKLANGLRVLLKPRRQAHNVSIRLAVRLGTRHFDCDQIETPHLIEHLLFSGTSKHTEAELDRMIEEHGGSWNATTGQEYTVYEIDIFDQYAGLALDTLYEIMTDTQFTGEKIAKAKDIVASEAGGRPSFIRQFLYGYDIGKTAWRKANEWLLPGNVAVCPDLLTLDTITGSTITEVFQSSYTPQNMTLIVVGNFEAPSMFKKIRKTFGTIEPVSAEPRTMRPVPPPSRGPVRVTGSFAPFLGSSGYVAAAFRTAGWDSPDAPVLAVLSSYLNTQLYEQVRIEKGLSYSPEAAAVLKPDYGILYVSADAGLGKIDHVHGLISRILERVVKTPPSADEVKRTKQKLLLQWVQGYETNAGFAGYYAVSTHDLDILGAFRNYEKEIEKVSADDVARVIKTTLRDERKVEINEGPTLSYTRFYTVVCLALFVAFLAIFIALRRAMTREKRMPWYRR